MKLLRHGPKGHEKPAILHTDGTLRDLSSLMADIGPSTLSREGMAALASLDVSTLPIVPQGRLAVPWTGMRKFIAIGLNYADHAAEANMPIPAEPIVFTKTVDSAVGCMHPVVLPQGSIKSDWEVELGVVIGTRARYVSEADALKHVAGYCATQGGERTHGQVHTTREDDKGLATGQQGNHRGLHQDVGQITGGQKVRRCDAEQQAQQQHRHDRPIPVLLGDRFHGVTSLS